MTKSKDRKKRKTIVTAAVTGSVYTPDATPHLPITPEQIANEAIRSCEAGAAIAHLHARDPETGNPSADVELYREIVERIREKSDIIIQITTGGFLTMSFEQRTATIPALKPEMASFNMGSMNFLVPNKPETRGAIFANTFNDLEKLVNLMKENKVKPEHEIYDPGMLGNTMMLLKQGLIEEPVHLDFVLGIRGGIEATPESLIFLKQMADRYFNDYTWSVCAAAQYEFPMVTLGMILGGNPRVGMEDNVYLSKGVLAKSNAELVEKTVRIAADLGKEIASPDEAREILGLKKLSAG